MENSIVPLGRPNLAPLEDIIPLLEEIWDRRVVTNCGPYHEAFEQAISEYLGVKYATLVSNATLGLMLALKVLDLKGEVVTSPFSFVATANALRWVGLKPVFADIEPVFLNLDPRKVEEAVTSETTAILPVHAFGRICDGESLQKLTESYKLRTVYDAAHAFGVRSIADSFLNWGDVSVVSFHATKVFNSIEGGVIISHDASTKKRLDALRNNGIDGNGDVLEVGLNAKMSEVHAAIGLVNLQNVDSSISKLGCLELRYRDALKSVSGIRLIDYPQKQTCNHSYFPIVIEKGYSLSRDALWKKLADKGVLAKRYFYPLISDLPAYRDVIDPSIKPCLPVATQLAESILCLPMLAEMEEHEFDRIIDLIVE